MIIFISIVGTEREGGAALEYRLAAGSLTGVAADGASPSTGTPARVQEFETLQGQVQLSNLGQFTRTQASYSLAATKWIESTQNYTLSHMLRLGCTIEAAATTSIALDASATLTQLSMLDSSATMADPQAVSARPAGNQEFITFQVGEGFTWQPSAAWRFGESLSGRLYKPIGGATASGSNKSLALDAQLSRVWSRDSTGLRGRAGKMWTDVSLGTTASNMDSRYVDGALTWTHQWSEEWVHDVAAGVVVVQAGRTAAQSAASAGLAWRHLGNIVELRAGQGAESNIYLGTAYQRRYAGLRVGIPLNRLETLRLSLDGNIEHDWTTAADGSEPGANIYSGRAGLSWLLSTAFSVALDYSIRDQRASNTGSGQTTFMTLRRQMAMLTLEARYPTLF